MHAASTSVHVHVDVVDQTRNRKEKKKESSGWPITACLSRAIITLCNLKGGLMNLPNFGPGGGQGT